MATNLTTPSPLNSEDNITMNVSDFGSVSKPHIQSVLDSLEENANLSIFGQSLRAHGLNNEPVVKSANSSV